MTNYTLPENLNKEIDEFESLIKRFKKGIVNPIEMKAFRVPFGVYEQRKEESYMVRVRCAAGIITPSQFKRLAELSEEYSEGTLHLTTRQEIQIHDVKLDKIIPIQRELKKIGLSSRGGGGNTVRNIIGQEDAGVSLDEVFDITPYVTALTTRLISESDSWKLPRKYKIAFSGSRDDRGYATINDLGFIAKIKEGKKGFSVYIAGGMGSKPDVGKLLFDFVDEKEVYNIAEAIKQLFDKYGNRKNKHTARIRFLYKSLGAEEFRKKFLEEYETVKKAGHEPLVIEESINESEIAEGFEPESADDNNNFKIWKKRYTTSQKQSGLFMVLIPIVLGNIDNDDAHKLGDFLENFGENSMRFTKEQNILLRNIPEIYLANIYNYVKKTFSIYNRPVVIDRMIACAGASTCKLGICLSRGATEAIIKKLENGNLQLDNLHEFKMNLSGCPNCCGQHFASHLGFFGKASRLGEFMYPAYNIVAGANIKEGETKYAQKLGEVSARDLPSFTYDFLEGYLSKKEQFENFNAYIEQEGFEDIKRIAANYSAVPDFDTDKNYYFDWGARDVFSLASRGIGECSAGLFDLIEMDLQNIKDIRKKISEGGDSIEKSIYELVFYASRMLLITRGIEANTREEVFEAFSEHFVKAGYIDDRFLLLVHAAKLRDYALLKKSKKEAFILADSVIDLYNNMDNSLQFKKITASNQINKESIENNTDEKASDIVTKDFRNVACPMNFVKTKLELAKIKSGELLEIYLDDGEPIQNVPGSVKSEGHEIVTQTQIDNYWSVVIKKG